MAALVTAGGFQPYANKSRATLMRYLGNGKLEVKKVALQKIENTETRIITQAFAYFRMA